MGATRVTRHILSFQAFFFYEYMHRRQLYVSFGFRSLHGDILSQTISPWSRRCGPLMNEWNEKAVRLDVEAGAFLSDEA